MFRRDRNTAFQLTGRQHSFEWVARPSRALVLESSLARMIPELKLGVVAFANTGSAGQALSLLEKGIFSSMIPALAAAEKETE